MTKIKQVEILEMITQLKEKDVQSFIVLQKMLKKEIEEKNKKDRTE